MPFDPDNVTASKIGDPNFRVPSDMLDTNFKVPKDLIPNDVLLDPNFKVPKDVVVQIEDARRSTLSETTAEIMNDMGLAPKRAKSGTMTVSLAWNNLSYTITNKKEQKKILEGASGVVRPGEVMAIMGPSGAGKSTLLDVLAGRKDPSRIGGQLLVNGREGNIRHYSTYVMQDDALMGVMTVRENIMFAADLCLSSSLSDRERRHRVEQIIKDFGLERVADSRIGTVFLRGVSGGEKRRCAIASQVITVPPVIFLDEPTTGLDSSASYHVMKAILEMARSRRIAVIASIHQPSTETFGLFDKLCLIARGRTVYCGNCDGALDHFASMGYECPTHTNPSDHYLRLINVDFMENKAEAENHVNEFIASYERSDARARVRDEIEHVLRDNLDEKDDDYNGQAQALGQFRRYARGPFSQTWIIMRRSFSNSYRNILVFWIRVAMYMCLAMLMGTTWWQTGYDQVSIEDRFSAHFFSVAFLVFMSVAGIPAFIEERASFQRERANNFYSVGPYVLANTLVAIPYVFIIAISFDMIAYPMIGLHKGLSHFLNHLCFLFLALIVAESMVVFVAAVIPIFVAALAIVAFMNGFFMVVQGFFVRRQLIPKGWKWAHYIDYQKYAFEAIVKNDFQQLTFDCEKQVIHVNGTAVQQCRCHYGNQVSPDSCTFTGQDVLDNYGYTEIKFGEWALALIALFLIFRVGFYIVLRLRRGHH